VNPNLVSKLEALGFAVLSDLTRYDQRVLVHCNKCGNEFEASYEKLQSSAKKCSCIRETKRNQQLQMNLEFLSSLARSKGGKLITTDAMTLREKWHFQCSEGHTWFAQGQSVKIGTWCPKCGGAAPRTLAELQEIVDKRGGKLLSSEYKGVDATYTFKCNLGHEFANMFKKVEKGQWCPTCNKGKKSEEIARATFEHLFGVPFKKVRPSWLRNSRGRIMEIDGYSEALKIGFEYQGIQHFEQIGIYAQDVEVRIEDDELKYKLCEDNGIKLFYLTYKDAYEDFPKRIKEQADRFGLDTSSLDFDSEVDLSSAYIRDDRIEELKNLLAPKGIRVLSKKWLTSDAKYSLECLVCGNKWRAQGNMFFNSRRVAGCRVCALKEVAGANRGELQDLKDFANGFGGECLAETYVQRRWVYNWRCNKGHTFEGNFNNMKFRNEFCPVCEGRVLKEFVSETEAVAKFAEARLELLGAYTGKRDWVKVRCEVCGVEGLQKYQNLAEGMPACKSCDHAAKEAEALAVMMAAGVKPLAPYVNVSSKWLSECLTCHRQVSPSYVNVKRGQGACVYCGYEKTKQTVRSRKGTASKEG
jgi:hypothetical protein